MVDTCWYILAYVVTIWYYFVYLLSMIKQVKITWARPYIPPTPAKLPNSNLYTISIYTISIFKFGSIPVLQAPFLCQVRLCHEHTRTLGSRLPALDVGFSRWPPLPPLDVLVLYMPLPIRLVLTAHLTVPVAVVLARPHTRWPPHPPPWIQLRRRGHRPLMPLILDPLLV